MLKKIFVILTFIPPVVIFLTGAALFFAEANNLSEKIAVAGGTVVMTGFSLLPAVLPTK